MTIRRVEDQVVVMNGEAVIEKLSPEEALLIASDLTQHSDAILKATSELEPTEVGTPAWQS